MIKCLLAAATVLLPTTSFAATDAPENPAVRRQVILITGAPGSEQYGEQFTKWADRWQKATDTSENDFACIGNNESNDKTDKERLKEKISLLAKSSSPEIWFVLIGHGTFYRDVAKFNLRGPDISAKELGNWIAPLKGRLVIVNCTSSSGPFINRLSGANRTIVTATKSGNEQNYARFGDFLSSTIADPSADLNHDDEVSLLEAFLSASGRVAEFYESEGRLATEHALIDDNGDTLGTAATFFRGTRVTKQAKQKGKSVDGRSGSRTSLFRSEKALRFTEEQLEERADIESRIESLRDQKPSLSQREYLAKIEPLLLEMAEFYESVEQANSDKP